jgi:hypothetical protein
MAGLCASEINLSIENFYDDGWRVRLGNDANGIKAERKFSPWELGDAASWLASAACAQLSGIAVCEAARLS